MKGEKSRGDGVFRSLIVYCRPYLLPVLLALLLGGFGTYCSVIGPSKIADITDLIAEGLSGSMDFSAITRICVFLVTLYGLSFLFGYVQNVVMGTVTQRVSQLLRSDIMKKINRIPLDYFDRTSYGDVLSRVTNDVDTIGQSFHNSICSLILSVALIIGTLVMMVTTNLVMAVSAIAASLIGVIIMMRIRAGSQKYFSAQQHDLGKIQGYIEEVYSGHQIVKLYTNEQNVEQDFDNLNTKLYHSAWKAQCFSGLMGPLMGFVGNLGYVVVCVLGALLVTEGRIGFGTIVSFMIYIRLFTQPLSQLAQVTGNLQFALAAGERVFGFLGEEELEDESGKTRKLRSAAGNVEFEGVRFGYSKEKEILHHFSASVSAGQKVAIVGPTGAGKTTIVNLLMRFYEIQDGRICIDGIPTSELTRENVHGQFCMVLQDAWLFEGTLRENLVYAKEGVTDADLDRVCEAVGLAHYVKSLPLGYDTMLNEQMELSVGQKQLVTIARAMLVDAPLLILDEATSSVDTKTEMLVQKAMDALTAERTSFVIAHRLSTIRNADLILVMKDGDVIESGTHRELLEQDGFYAELYNSQFACA